MPPPVGPPSKKQRGSQPTQPTQAEEEECREATEDFRVHGQVDDGSQPTAQTPTDAIFFVEGFRMYRLFPCIDCADGLHKRQGWLGYVDCHDEHGRHMAWPGLAWPGMGRRGWLGQAWYSWPRSHVPTKPTVPAMWAVGAVGIAKLGGTVGTVGIADRAGRKRSRQRRHSRTHVLICGDPNWAGRTAGASCSSISFDT